MGCRTKAGRRRPDGDRTTKNVAAPYRMSPARVSPEYAASPVRCCVLVMLDVRVVLGVRVVLDELGVRVRHPGRRCHEATARAITPPRCATC